MKRKVLFGLILCMVFAMLMAAGCKKKQEEEPIKEEEPVKEDVVEQPKEEIKEEAPIVEEEILTEEVVTVPEGMARSFLTGEWIDEEVAKLRPYAVMIGNTVDALPHYGLSNADIIYEAPVEGSYTRLMAIFQDDSLMERVGSIRSCRHYFVRLALGFDAIYAHYGQAIYAEPLLAESYVNNLSGLEGSVENLAYYRSSDRKAPHNVFTTGKGLNDAAEMKGYRREHEEGYTGGFLFAEDDAPVVLEGEDALVVSPGYFITKPWFVYNEEDGLYYRYAYKKEHIDAGAENKQLAFENLIIQFCEYKKLDDNDYLDVYVVGHGDGKYITGGKMIDITWEKESETSPTRFYDVYGNEIIMNQGKSMICVVRSNYKDRFAVYNTQEELLKARGE